MYTIALLTIVFSPISTLSLVLLNNATQISDVSPNLFMKYAQQQLIRIVIFVFMHVYCCTATVNSNALTTNPQMGTMATQVVDGHTARN